MVDGCCVVDGCCLFDGCFVVTAVVSLCMFFGERYDVYVRLRWSRNRWWERIFVGVTVELKMKHLTHYTSFSEKKMYFLNGRYDQPSQLSQKDKKVNWYRSWRTCHLKCKLWHACVVVLVSTPSSPPYLCTYGCMHIWYIHVVAHMCF